MKKMLSALFACMLVLLTACGISGSSVLLEEERLGFALPPELTDSELYREAVNSGSILLYNGIPITSADQPEKQLEHLLEKNHAVLTVYQFIQDKGDCRASISQYQNEKGEIKLYYGEVSDWITAPSLKQTATAENLHLTRYGYLAPDNTDAVPGIAVIHPSELFEDTAENQKLFDTYLRPLFHTAIGYQVWSSPEEAGDLLNLAEELAAYEGTSFTEEYPEGDIPVNYLVELLSRYFDGIDRKAVVYTKYDFDYPSDTMHYTFERPEPEEKQVRVLTSTQQDNLLRISYCMFDPNTGEPDPDGYRVLTVSLLEDGSFHYMSNLMA